MGTSPGFPLNLPSSSGLVDAGLVPGSDARPQPRFGTVRCVRGTDARRAVAGTDTEEEPDSEGQLSHLLGSGSVAWSTRLPAADLRRATSENARGEGWADKPRNPSRGLRTTSETADDLTHF